MPKCYLCSRKAVVHFKFSKPLCANHFIKQIESRVKKEFRRTNIINLHKEKKLDTVIIVKDTDYNDTIIKRMIEPILKKSRITIERKNRIPNRIPEGKIVISEKNTDYLSDTFMTKLFNGKDPCFTKERIVFPLKNVLRTEAYIYKLIIDKKISNQPFFDQTRINRLDAKLRKNLSGKELVVDKWLSSIEEKHPGTKFSMMRSYAFFCENNRQMLK